MHDHQWLYNAPNCPEAIKWSEDNHLAIAAASSVVILNPGHLNGPRAVAVGPQGSFLGAVSVDAVPQEWQDSFQLVWSVATEIKAGDQQKQTAPVRAMAWSPAGCSAQAGCLLAAVSADHQVRIYSAHEKSLSSEWLLVLNVSDLLKKQLIRTEWQDVDALAHEVKTSESQTQTPATTTKAADAPLRLKGGASRPQSPSLAAPQQQQQGYLAHTAAGAADSVLRLRGGAGGKRALARQAAEPGLVGDAVEHGFTFSVGLTVEVMNDEEGLRGCWFAADVRSTEGRWVLVEYHELLMEGHENLPADQQQRLQEWFPLSGAKQSEAAKLPGSAPKHWGPGYKIRPQPPNEVSCVGRVPDSDVTPGTIIEAHTDCGYWVGRIKSITLPADSKTADAADTSAEPQFTVKVLEAEDVLTVAAKQLRYALVWGKDGSWERMPVPATPADKRKAAASKSKSTVKRGDADAAAATPSQPASTAAAGTAGTDTAAGPSAQPAASQPQAEAAANGNTVKSPFDNLIKGVRTSDTQEVVKKVPQLIAKRMLAMRGEGCEPYQHKEQMRPADGILIERAADELWKWHGPILDNNNVIKEHAIVEARRFARIYISRQQERANAGTKVKPDPDAEQPATAGADTGAEAGPSSQGGADGDAAGPSTGNTSKGKGSKGSKGGKSSGSAAKSPRKPRTGAAKKSLAESDGSDGDGGGGAAGAGGAAAPAEPDIPGFDVRQTDPRAFHGLIPECQMDVAASVAKYSSQLVTKRWIVLRQLSGDFPRYADRESIKGIDVVNFHRAVKELYFLYREYLESEKVNRIVLNRNARALIRYNIMKAEGQLRAKEATQRRAQGDESGSEGAEEEGDMTQSEGDSEGSDGEEKPGKKPRLNGPSVIAVPFKLDPNSVEPNTFSSLVLDVDYSNDASIKASAHHMLVQRFAQLRNATPLEMLPQYKPGMHISGVDAELLSRTVAEFDHLYGTRVGGITQDKPFMQKVRAMIREKVLGTKRDFFRSDYPGGGVMYKRKAVYAHPDAAASQPIHPTGNSGVTMVFHRPPLKSDKHHVSDRHHHMSAGGSGAAHGRSNKAPDSEGPRARRARKVVKYKESSDSESPSGSDGGKKSSKAKKKRKRVTSGGGDDSSDEYRVSEDEEVKARRSSGRGRGKGDGSDGGDLELSSDEVSLDSDAERNDDNAMSVDNESDLSDVIGGESEEEGVGGGRGSGGPLGKPVRRSRQGKGSLRVMALGARAAMDADGNLQGWRRYADLEKGLPEAQYVQIPYRVKPEAEVEGTGAVYRTFSLQRRKPIAANWYGHNGRLQTSKGERVPGPVYDARMLSLAVLNVSWSPVCCAHASATGQHTGPTDSEKDTRVTYMALGTKAGVVHMFRYTLPTRYSLSDSAAEGGDSGAYVPSSLRYCGALKAHVNPHGFVTATSWLVAAGSDAQRAQLTRPRQAVGAETLLLATGSSDGSITLWSSPSHTLCTAADVSCWQPCATVNPPDSLAVTCIDLVWTEPSEPGQPTHLLVCAGKTCGSVFVWRSGPVTLSHSTQQTGQGLQAALKAGASSWLTRGVHGLHSVSGISIQPWQCGVEGTQGGWQLLSSTATDGEVRCFKISSTGMEACGSPCRFNPASAYNAPKSIVNVPQSKSPAYGLAASGNGLLQAVVRTTGIFQAELEQSSAADKMTWAKVAQGSVHLYTPFGPEGPCGPVLPVLRRLVPQLQHQWASPASLWDLAASVLSAGWEHVALPLLPQLFVMPTKEEEDADEDGGDDDGDGTGAVTGGGPAHEAQRQRTLATQYLAVIKRTAAVLSVMNEVVGYLDNRYRQEAGGTSTESAKTPLSKITLPAWRGLSAATQLRQVVLTHMDNHQQLTKSLSVIHPILTLPDGSAPEPLADAERFSMAASHIIPPWLLDAKTHASLQRTEEDLVNIRATLHQADKALTDSELQLVQHHVWLALGGAGGAGGGSKDKAAAAAPAGPVGLAALMQSDCQCLTNPHNGGASGSGGRDQKQLWQQLMTEWVWKLPDGPRKTELMALVKGPSPTSPVETSATLGVKVAFAGATPVLTARCAALLYEGGRWRSAAEAAAGSGAATEQAEPLVLELPRCGACMQLCEASSTWHCPVCDRRYMDAPAVRPDGLRDWPYCVVCSVRLAATAAPASFLATPSVHLEPIPPEPITIA